ncbi:MAG: pyrimidine 5'-nucleotidase [Pseudomonadota bacterium]
MTLLSDESFADVTDWVFDLDNTLYPAACNLFHQIDARMTSFIEGLLSLPYAEARKIQKDLYVEHGTTLAGLMKAYNVDPHDFMEHVHDIDLSAIGPHQGLREVMASLPGRRFVHTNGSQKHAENVLGALGLDDIIDDIFDVEMGSWIPKPHASNYEAFRKRVGLNTDRAAMFEDMSVNLEVPHALGMRTILITSDAAWIDDEPEDKRPGAKTEEADHIHHVTSDLAGFLEALMQPERKTA